MTAMLTWCIESIWNPKVAPYHPLILLTFLVSLNIPPISPLFPFLTYVVTHYCSFSGPELVVSLLEYVYWVVGMGGPHPAPIICDAQNFSPF